MTSYVRINETNDWEGETWSFFIPEEGNEGALAELSRLLEELEEFSIGSERLSEAEVDCLVKHGNDDPGYMSRYHKLSGTLDLFRLSGSAEGDYPALTKGRIRNLMRGPDD